MCNKTGMFPVQQGNKVPIVISKMLITYGMKLQFLKFVRPSQNYQKRCDDGVTEYLQIAFCHTTITHPPINLNDNIGQHLLLL